ncbi:MAG: hypothetical protein V7727_00255 [Sneathiella sp.]
MKIKYRSWDPKPESIAKIDQANEIIEEYQLNGYVLTLRQLYYQFIIRKWLDNTERSYKNLGTLVTKGREAGLISWAAIEDRNREHHEFFFQEDERSVLEDLEYGIRFDLWERQEQYIEVWVEKEALGNVIERPCRSLRVPYMSCKGFLSASAAWLAGERFKAAQLRGKRCVMIHLGDHDPSGIDMTRDNKKRIDLFSRSHDVDVKRIALNMDQVDHYRPPPNPAKTTDSRATGYIEKFGTKSWELDALEPSVIEELIREEVERHIDQDIWQQTLAEQEEARQILSRLHDNWDEVRELLEEK